jgi:hypothetical protein
MTDNSRRYRKGNQKSQKKNDKTIHEHTERVIKNRRRRNSFGILEHVLYIFQFICSYLFWPVAYVMGVHQADCRVVGELIGIKTFINEFVAYEALSKG